MIIYHVLVNSTKIGNINLNLLVCKVSFKFAKVVHAVQHVHYVKHARMKVLSDRYSGIFYAVVVHSFLIPVVINIKP